MKISAPAPLSDIHETGDFDSGQPTLDDWLRRRARPNQVSGASRTFVVCEGANIIGFYSLASSSITASDATRKMKQNMPNPIPVVILGRLAIDHRYQKRGLGRALVRDAAKRVLAAGEEIGIRGMLVHALDENAKAFYLEMGFGPSPTSDLTLMISISDLRQNL